MSDIGKLLVLMHVGTLPEYVVAVLLWFQVRKPHETMQRVPCVAFLLRQKL